MNKSMWKTTLREIRSSLGRYLAILAIIALGVGFFSGLKVTKQTMIEAGDRFLKQHEMFDFRLISTLGLTKEDASALSMLEGVKAAKGSYHADAIINKGSSIYVASFISLDDTINTPDLKYGRMPEASGEILADGRFFSESDIGSKITLSEENLNDTLDNFSIQEFTIVGIAYTPLYLNYERGTTSVGNGSVSCFFLALPEDFDIEVYTDIYLTLSQKEYIYSDEYDELIDSFTPTIESALTERAMIRYNSLYSEAEEKLKNAGIELGDANIMLSDAVQQLLDFKEPSTYVLTRDENIGYACFENDSQIVDGIAVVFPVFFFIVAALVCVTTMSRMIEEQRTQIGVLKALGYSNKVIMSKYLTYSGSAALFGCIGGFYLGCYAFPKIIWIVYGLMYGFTDISFVFDPVLFIISLAVSLICSAGTTYISCRYDLAGAAAELIRPRAPKSGKRIFLERIGFLWKKLPFLHKVSIRNIFRYKGRFLMMMLGIGGCAGLIVTGFGIRDSVSDIANVQYSKIQIYDEQINFSEKMTTDDLIAFEEEFSDKIDVLMPIYQFSADPVDTDSIRAMNVVVLGKEENWREFLLLHENDSVMLDFPEKNKVILTQNVADANNINVGDTITLRDSDFNELKLTVSGICDNYFNSYAYISSETYMEQHSSDSEGTVPYKSAFVCIKDGIDLHEASASFLNNGKVTSVSVNADTMEMFSKMMQTMNYIVVLVIACAAALAFIVLYNLTNINITERIREIATIKVLGFYPGETASYVFRENLVLTVIGALVGLPLGVFLHAFVMSNVKIDMVSFDVHINSISYLYAVLFTLAFAAIVDFILYFKLARINMAESLKSIE
ncbi:MAG: ABC transporter permease [Lachnospiraceae bacterium]|nr:ABC transporter permease [Lachnospiraceae bacterium]